MPQSGSIIEELKWPPDYTIKRHPRARHVKLKASVQRGLEIVVPMKFSQKHIPDILDKNKHWIEQRLREIQSSIRISTLELLPSTIALLAINEIWQIEYVKSNNPKIRLITRPQKELVLLGDIENKEYCQKILIEWIKLQAEIHLCRKLEKISQIMALPFKRVSIRDQRSRWGSCTSDKSISLNYKLLFIPAELMNHVLIHELCHTVHLNHSPHFWRLVAVFDPQWKKHNAELRQAEKWMPQWVNVLNGKQV